MRSRLRAPMPSEEDDARQLLLEEREQERGSDTFDLSPLVAEEAKYGDITEDILQDPEPVDEDLYGVSVASLLRDSRRIAQGHQLGLRASRIAATTATLLATVFVQAYLVYQFKRLITAKTVHRIREIYDEYEVHMYGNFTTLNEHKWHRGTDGHFRSARFSNLPLDKKSEVCQIPLSQPHFLGFILAIWSFTVVIDIRRILFLIDLFLVRTPSDGVTLSTMLAQTGEGHEVVLEGLPVCMKALLLLLILLPRLVLDVVLCWLGTRWLAATDDFADVLLNAMALEFILLLKDLLYTAVVPMRDKFETRTMLVPMRRRMKPSCCSFLGSFAWTVVVALWVVLYMDCLQQVLPGYRWDVHDVCLDFISDMIATGNGRRNHAAKAP
mmetsp:Transcript_64824/g.179746  ORF Transcript_64824/g.179746 Transcript_64824/m.179746 type:complete len:383 (-) Transcript_64824:71-1219(-)